MPQPPRGPMTGRTVLITGGTSGIGKATAVGLAGMGAHLAITGRNRERATRRPLTYAAAGADAVDVFVADLSSQTEVRGMAAEALERLARIDVLINNAGGYWNTRHVTADGFERTFALNHLAPFLLTDLLLDRLKQRRAVPGGDGVVQRTPAGPDRLRRPARRAVLLRLPGLQPVETGQHPVHLRTGQTAGRHRSPP